jgi:nucleoside-diphosphate-sugar epimerase
MVVGDGMMARAFSTFLGDERVVIFASGVSNSLETDPGAFAREERLLLQIRAEHPDKLVVYFGTCSADDPERRHTPYVLHKLALEKALSTSKGPWMVLRLPLAIGRGQHGHTLAQFLHDKIKSGQPFEVWRHATRYPVDVEDILRIANCFVEDRSMWNRVINIALRAFPVLEYVHSMENFLGRKAIYSISEKGKHYKLSCPEMESKAKELNLDFSERYLARVLEKYFREESGNSETPT